MTQTIKIQSTGLVIEAELLKSLGLEGDSEVEIHLEGHRVVVEAVRGARLQRLSDDLNRLMACGAETLPQLGS
jgi:antitoxin component of MazEF toxin-antitoxin module